MKYKNIVFDFGNVIGKFNGRYIMKCFCSSDEDALLLAGILYQRWAELDKGTIDYQEYAETMTASVPERLRRNAEEFFKKWPEHIVMLDDTLEFIRQLKEKGAKIYLLSNAPTYLAEWSKHFEFLKTFDGVVFSAPIKMAKPKPEIYRYLFETYSLDPKNCFFIDDLNANIETGRSLGMEGIVFNGDIDEVKRMIEF